MSATVLAAAFGVAFLLLIERTREGLSAVTFWTCGLLTLIYPVWIGALGDLLLAHAPHLSATIGPAVTVVLASWPWRFITSLILIGAVDTIAVLVIWALRQALTRRRARDTM